MAAAAQAELVILTDGEFLKVESYRADATRATLALRDGATISLPLQRIERVLDDEVLPVDPQAPAPSVGPVAAVIPIRFDGQEPIPEVPFGAFLYDAAKRHDVHPRIVVELARAESNFRPTAVSYKGAVGLLQIMPATGRRFGLNRAELFDPKKNLDAGVRYLAWLLQRFEGDLSKALAGYNAGEGAVERFAGIPPYRETQRYVKKILAGLAPPPPVVAAGL
jgi:soluble lytic murein transglycosylase-like protein